MTVAGVVDALDCRPHGQDVLGVIVDTHSCEVDDRTVFVHEITSSEVRDRALEYLARRFVGNPCPDGSTATYVVVTGPDWAAVAPNRAVADVVAGRTGGDTVPVDDGAGVPISYLLPGDSC